MTEDIVKKLQLTSERKESLKLNMFGDAEFRSKSCKLVSFNIELKDGQVAVVKALSYPEICSPLPTGVEFNSYPHLQGQELANKVDAESSDAINILIGADLYYDIVIGNVIRGEEGPVAVASKLGWVLSGTLRPSKFSRGDCMSAHLCIEIPRTTESDSNGRLADSLTAFWEVENSGLGDGNLVDSTDSEGFCVVSFTGDRDEVGLPWKLGEPLEVTNNYDHCKTYLQSLHSRLTKDT